MIQLLMSKKLELFLKIYENLKSIFIFGAKMIFYVTVSIRSDWKKKFGEIMSESSDNRN